MKRVPTLTLLGLIGGLVSACSTISGTKDAPLTPSELNARPDYYDGREVVVRGYVNIEPEGHVIDESKQIFDEFATKINSGAKDFNPNAYEKYCLTILHTSIVNPSGKKFGKTMTISGKFVANYMNGRRVDLGACPLPPALIIDKVVFSEN